MPAASPLVCCYGTTPGLRRPVDVLTVQPALTGCLQVQPTKPIDLRSDVQSEVGRKQVSIFGDAALAAVNPLRKQLLLTLPAQTGLRQGRRSWVVLEERLPAGAFSLAAQHLYQ